jgi:hypothetical protein
MHILFDILSKPYFYLFKNKRNSKKGRESHINATIGVGD